jgi:heavy metal sensor kinase
VNIKQEKVTFGNVNYQGGVTLRLVVMPVSFNNFGRYIIEVGTFTIPVVHALRKRIVSTALSILAILVIAIIISYLLVWRILGPVQQVARTAKTISYENLSHRVKVERLDEEMKYLAESFNDMIARLEESFKYVSEFSSSVAHDLRTPLTIIKGETEVALQSGQNFEDCRRVMQSNLDEVERMLKTIDNMLMLTEIKYRKEAFSFERMDLASFLNDIYEKTVILASQKNITVTFPDPKEPLITMVNQLYLRRLFFNLIHNAIKFTPQGGAINFSVRRAHKRVFVAITDTGIGITDDDRAKIFNKFFRAQSVDRNNEPGSGLGLSIAQSIASMHQGCIEVRSAVGKGSTFTVILPIL